MHMKVDSTHGPWANETNQRQECLMSSVADRSYSVWQCVAHVAESYCVSFYREKVLGRTFDINR